MNRGRVPTEGVQLVNRLQEILFVFEPATETQKLIHAETLRSFNLLAHARRERVDAATTALPDVLWWVLLPGAFACLVLSLFYRIEEPLLQYVCSVGLAGFIAMVLFVIFALDRPFIGDLAITPESYERVYDHLMKP
jgi:lipopolysaccharide export LptBFGC system permease protein LptF